MNTFCPHSVMQPMKKLRPHSLLFVAVCAALLHLATPAARAADANPPGKLTYQGFLTDASGVPLGNTAPFNTNIIFRIYTASTGGTLKWSESQVVTLDKGHFSVLLGEGSAVEGETAAYTNNLSGIFTGADASDRFMQISVGAGVIAPRLQFLPAPYALLARSANQVVSPAGANILSVIANGNVGINNASPVSALDVGGTVTATAFSGNGALLSAINAAAVTSGTLNNARTTATDANTASAIVARDASGNFTAGAITAASFSGNGSNLTSLDASKVTTGTLNEARIPRTLPGNLSVDSLNIAGRALIDVVYPVGVFYTQYPDVDSNVETTAFPTSRSPGTLFAGTTWVEQFTDGVFFRTKGGNSAESRADGVQDYALKQLTGHTSYVQADYWRRAAGQTGVFASGVDQQTGGTDSGSSSDSVVRSYFDSAIQALPSQTEVRPKNRLMKIWKRTN